MFLWIASVCRMNAPDYAPLRRLDARMQGEIFWLAGFFGFLVATSLVLTFAVAALISSGLVSAQFGEVLIFWLIIEILIWRTSQSSQLELDALLPASTFSLNRLVVFGLVAGIVLTVAAQMIIHSVQVEIRGGSELPQETSSCVIYAIQAIIFAPLFEEILFRGFIQGALRRVLGSWPSIVLTTLGFAAIHYDGDWMLPLALLPVSLVLCITREMSGQLGPSILQHGLFNALSIGFEILG